MAIETIPAKTIVHRVKDPSWFGCEYNMNIYRGCPHGCIYCDSRSACYQNGDFDRVRCKADALRLIRDDLNRKVHTGVVMTGAMSDPYNPYERTECLTRHALELLNAYGFGVAIATKSDLIVRDIELLQEIGSHSPVLCKLTITTGKDDLARLIEPHVTSPSGRFVAIERLSSSGIFTGVLMMPLLPWITDDEENVRTVVKRASEAGARFVYPAMGLTMREGQREYLYQKLEENFPGQGLCERYRRQYGNRYRCSVPHANRLFRLFEEECHRYGLLYRMPEIVRAYRQSDHIRQTTLFG